MRETTTCWGKSPIHSSSHSQSQSPVRAMQFNWWGTASQGKGRTCFPLSCSPVSSLSARPAVLTVPMEIVSLCVQAKAHFCRHCHTQPPASRGPAFVIQAISETQCQIASIAADID